MVTTRLTRLQAAWRGFLALSLFVLATSAQSVEPVRIGLTPVFLDDQVTFLNRWREYLERELKRPVQFVRRSSYAEIVSLLRNDKLDFAWLCGFPYVKHRKELGILAIPVHQGRPQYQSFLIVPARDSVTQGLAGLKDRIFAYSDPDSNSGYLVAQYELAQLQLPAQNFFRKAFFTGSHRGVVEAVAKGLADGGVVDGYVYDALAKLQPELAERTRIVERSPFFGFPPFVMHRRVRKELVREMQRVLFAMSANPEGRKLLAALYLDSFSPGEAKQYDSIARMVDSLRKAGRVP